MLRLMGKLGSGWVGGVGLEGMELGSEGFKSGCWGGQRSLGINWGQRGWNCLIVCLFDWKIV